MPKDSFSGKEIPRGMGHMYVLKDGTVYFFLNQKSEKNFKKLGRDNIEVVSCTAGELIARPGFSSDFRGAFIYLDPSRRDAGGNRKYHPAHSTPDYFAMEEALLETAGSILLKTSPMFDHREGIRVLKNVKSVTAISVSG